MVLLSLQANTYLTLPNLNHRIQQLNSSMGSRRQRLPSLLQNPKALARSLAAWGTVAEGLGWYVQDGNFSELCVF